GGDVELDRGLLNTLVPAFEHMLRNSLAHGIELPDERAARGKSREGRIQLHITSQGGLIQIALEDDGAGIDVEGVRRKARERGILDARSAEDDQAAMQLIFHSGISTAKEVSQVAGRGVGMDVVAEALRQVGGDIQVESQRGWGARFKLHVPLTQSITQGVVVVVDEQVFALPYSGIEAILRDPAAHLSTLFDEDKPTWEYAGEQLPLVDLAPLLGLSSSVRRAEGMVPLMVLRLGERRMVLRVDALQGSQQLFIKALGPFLSRVPALAGATLLGDGRVVLVLDVAELFRLASQARTKPVEVQAAGARRAQVLVVDDSITIRKVTTRILERYGIEVATAKDGVDALAWLHDHMPTVVLSDIEMPRMDGFELLASIRNEARLKHLPVVMITSRTGQKHRDKAEALGVSAYLGKPYTEAELMQILQAWLPEDVGLATSSMAGGAV
ncbi:MAG: hybrid sensor histidine kinase/response regulator, partial [Halothiobacillaceae bacterium]